MKNLARTVLLALLLTLSGRTALLHAADPNDSPAAAPAHWENVSAAFTKEIGADDLNPSYLDRVQGMIVTPPGDIVILTARKGIAISKDQGATWSLVPASRMVGRCENGAAISVAYPYSGRFAFFAYDGKDGQSGDMTLDGGQTWTPFTQVHRGMESGDVDWTAASPQTIFGFTHEPFFTLLSQDAGRSWKQIYPDDNGARGNTNYNLGVVSGQTLLRANPTARGPRSSEPPGLIELSADAGQTWTPVAHFAVRNRRPVHYGPHLYWLTTQGVITSANGKDWTLTGPGAEGALYGPYFGLREQEIVAVTNKTFLKTTDGGKTWKQVAAFYKVPDIFHNSEGYCCFGWDAKNDILYSSGLGGSVYRLKL